MTTMTEPTEKCDNWIPEAGRGTNTLYYHAGGRTCRNKYVSRFQSCKPCYEARIRRILATNVALVEAIEYARREGWTL